MVVPRHLGCGSCFQPPAQRPRLLQREPSRILAWPLTESGLWDGPSSKAVSARFDPGVQKLPPTGGFGRLFESLPVSRAQPKAEQSNLDRPFHGSPGGSPSEVELTCSKPFPGFPPPTIARLVRFRPVPLPSPSPATFPRFPSRRELPKLQNHALAGSAPKPTSPRRQLSEWGKLLGRHLDRRPSSASSSQGRRSPYSAAGVLGRPEMPMGAYGARAEARQPTRRARDGAHFSHFSRQGSNLSLGACGTRASATTAVGRAGSAPQRVTPGSDRVGERDERWRGEGGGGGSGGWPQRPGCAARPLAGAVWPLSLPSRTPAADPDDRSG